VVALRDVVQNHLLQVLAVIAMEPPVGSGLDPGRDKKVDVFRAMPEADPSMYERDQYEGYLQIPRVKPASATETYVVVEREQDCARRGEQLVSAANSLSCIGRDRISLWPRQPLRLPGSVGSFWPSHLTTKASQTGQPRRRLLLLRPP
jgi:Glucose-6-phosphate dehydrogenase, C-terminal domain